MNVWMNAQTNTQTNGAWCSVCLININTNRVEQLAGFPNYMYEQKEPDSSGFNIQVYLLLPGLSVIFFGENLYNCILQITIPKA